MFVSALLYIKQSTNVVVQCSLMQMHLFFYDYNILH